MRSVVQMKLKCHRKNDKEILFVRHVLAAAVRGRCDMLHTCMLVLSLCATANPGRERGRNAPAPSAPYSIYS